MQTILADKVGAQARKITLRHIGKAIKQLTCDDSIKDGIAKELKPLVMWRAVAAVRQRGL